MSNRPRPEPIRVVCVCPSSGTAPASLGLKRLGARVLVESVADVGEARVALWGHRGAFCLLPASTPLELVRELASDGVRVVAYAHSLELDAGDALEEAGVVGLSTGQHPHHLYRILRAANRREASQPTRCDALTGLPDRSVLLEALHRSMGEEHDLFVLDVAGFASINATWGHAVGDRILRVLAARLAEALPEALALARIGSDELAAITPAGLTTPTELRELLAGQILAGSDTISPRLRAVCTSLRHHQHAETALVDATGQLRDLKRCDGASAYHQPDAAGVARHLRLASELQDALDKHQLYLCYQPIVSMSTGHIAGFEALIRWKHPILGNISPADFIPIAEQTGAIIPIGKWVLQQACLCIRDLRTHHPAFARATMSVNLSPRQLADPRLVDTVAAALAGATLQPSAVHLELTEGRALRDEQSDLATMTALRDLGVELHVDDFGTGNANLAYLHRLPVDVLKIDRSFISGFTVEARATTLVLQIIELARRLGLRVVAEGIETPRQLGALMRAGVDFGQGYLLARPMPPSRLGELAGRDLRVVMA